GFEGCDPTKSSCKFDQTVADQCPQTIKQQSMASDSDLNPDGLKTHLVQQGDGVPISARTAHSVARIAAPKSPDLESFVANNKSRHPTRQQSLISASSSHTPLSTTVCKPQLQPDPNICPVRRDEPELKF
ncbi:hypothetical protein ACLOJK_006522, partial [Asimina triloba]